MIRYRTRFPNIYSFWLDDVLFDTAVELAIGANGYPLRLRSCWWTPESATGDFNRQQRLTVSKLLNWNATGGTNANKKPLHQGLPSTNIQAAVGGQFLYSGTIIEISMNWEMGVYRINFDDFAPISGTSTNDGFGIRAISASEGITGTVGAIVEELR